VREVALMLLREHQYRSLLCKNQTQKEKKTLELLTKS